MSVLSGRVYFEDFGNQRVQILALTNSASRELLCLGTAEDEAKRERDITAQFRATLVLHGRGDMRIPFEEGRLLAGLIPGSSFVTLETRNHLMMQDEPAWQAFLDALAAFYPPRAGSAIGSFPGLTAREREVLELIAQGLDNAQIAARLELSEKTVRNNITHIFDKIGVENRSQAIVLARESGLGAARRP